MMAIFTGEPWWSIDDTGITIINYPFRSASLPPDGRIEIERIDDVSLGIGDPTVRVGDELFFVSRRHEADLRRFVDRTGVPEVTWNDVVWGSILEPTLDTEFTPEIEQASYSILQGYGLDLDTVDELRRRFLPAVMRFNYHSWEWIHLGLFDLLPATAPGFRGPISILGKALLINAWPPLRSTRATYPQLYREAMRLALLEPRHRVRSQPGAPPRAEDRHEREREEGTTTG